MKTQTVEIESAIARHARANPVQRLARRVLLDKLQALERGELEIREGSERFLFGSRDGANPISASLEVTDPAFYASVVLGGNVGAGEAYMNGLFTCEDLPALVRLFAVNQDVLAAVDSGFSLVTRPLHRLFHLLHPNTIGGSRKNITAHYDLGNEFFRLFLDPTMSYSSAIFECTDMNLEEASLAKLRRICDKLALSPSDHLLEIGTGWGGLAEYAATHYGCRVTTTTISKEQGSFARERIRSAGLEDRVEILGRDYRELTGVYDKLVSVEMIEAVGHENLDRYFEACSRLLKPDGMMALQAIVMVDRFYEHARRSVDFIKRYIFPGSFLPSISAMLRSVARKTDLQLVHMEELTPSYAKTLRHWRERFLANRDRVAALGFDDRFIRMWEYYFAYCEGGFSERVIGDVQMLLAKPLCRVPAPLPPLSQGV
jgi:cyclopropane-fatty-acyl-phospholipid synthase